MYIKLYNPLEQFEVINYISVYTPINTFSITNSTLYLLIVTILSYIIFTTSNSHYNVKLVGNNYTILIESFYKSVSSIVKDQIGIEYEKYIPFIFALFNFILFSNLVGLVPYGFSPTAHFALTLSLSIAIIVGVTIIGFNKYGLRFFASLAPTGTPLGLVPLLVAIEFLSYLARALSLGIRLAANITAGHILLNIISGFIYKFITSGYVTVFFLSIFPFSLFIALVGLEIIVAILQAYV
jgi:F-type H+-transporting ATPase subunit a